MATLTVYSDSHMLHAKVLVNPCAYNKFLSRNLSYGQTIFSIWGPLRKYRSAGILLSTTTERPASLSCLTREDGSQISSTLTDCMIRTLWKSVCIGVYNIYIIILYTLYVNFLLHNRYWRVKHITWQAIIKQREIITNTAS